jgi:hypothetical protein
LAIVLDVVDVGEGSVDGDVDGDVVGDVVGDVTDGPCRVVDGRWEAATLLQEPRATTTPVAETSIAILALLTPYSSIEQ